MIEMNRSNIRVDPDIEVCQEDEEGAYLCAYLEIWFDAERKFGLHLSDDAWVNLYAMYEPVKGSLNLAYYIDADFSVSDPVLYIPTDKERQIITMLIEEKCREVSGKSCVEVLEEYEKE